MGKIITTIYISLSLLLTAQVAIAQTNKETPEQTNKTADQSTASTATVSGEELLKRSSLSPSNTLYGKLNGLTVLQNGGYGGAGEPEPTLFIRGLGTLNDNSILVLIDGLERPLSSLVTEEIEDITVLKDAAALAKYGLRGANGVLLIKTKRGMTDKPSIEVSYQHTFTSPARLPKFADAATYAEAVNEGLTNEGLPVQYTSPQIDAYRNGKYPSLYPNVNWMKETLREQGQRDQVNFAAHGGSAKVRYFSLINFASDRGLIKEADLNSYSTQLTSSTMNVRTNLDIDLTSTTQMSVNLLGKLREMNRPGAVTDNVLMQNLYSLPSNAYPVITHNGIWGGASSVYPANPVAQTSSTGYSSAHARSLFADMTLKQDLSKWVKGLNAEFRIGFDASSENWDSRTKQYLSESNVAHLNAAGVPVDTVNTQYGKIENELGFSTSLGAQERHANLQFGLNYTKEFTNSKLNASVMYKQDKRVALGQFNSYMHQDVVAYAHYGLQNRYFFDLSMSGSGTSRLPKDSRWGFFPAAAAAWNITNEQFMQQVSWLNLLKLRLSYGLTGNDIVTPNLDQYPFVGGNGFVFNDDFKWQTGTAEGHLPSSGVTFEKTSKLNIGIDTRFFNILTFNVDAFYDRTYDIMVNTQGVSSSMLGSINAFEPDGIVKNYGVEIGLNVSDKVGDFFYNVGGQFSFVRSNIVAMDEIYLPHDYLKATGRPVGQLFGLETIGFFKDEADIAKSPTQTFSTVYPGDFKYKDQNGDNRIDIYDQVAMGYNSMCPEIYYSASLELEYKGLGISAQFQGAANYSVILNTPGLYLPLMGNKAISTHYLENCWRPGADNSQAIYPRLTTTESNNNYKPNTVFVSDASYLKLRQAEVYYKLPQAWINKCRLQQLRVFARGMDLFSIDNIKVTDPESTGAVYPTLRSYHLGINLTF